MREVMMANVIAGRGIDAENRKTGRREVTLLSAERWREVCRELGVELPWHTRRANLLIEGIDLGAILGQLLTIGPIQLRIHGETRPCGIMDEQHPGLREALVPDFRGGVHAEVLVGGTVQVGDPVRLHLD